MPARDESRPSSTRRDPAAQPSVGAGSNQGFQEWTCSLRTFGVSATRALRLTASSARGSGFDRRGAVWPSRVDLGCVLGLYK